MNTKPTIKQQGRGRPDKRPVSWGTPWEVCGRVDEEAIEQIEDEHEHIDTKTVPRLATLRRSLLT